jgi:hypothetical protein
LRRIERSLDATDRTVDAELDHLRASSDAYSFGPLTMSRERRELIESARPQPLR